jgi:hypothetical protein
MKTTMDELAPYMRGWRGYFGFCETPEVLIGLTRWVRLRLRAAMWRHGWLTTQPAAGSAPGTSQRPRPFLSGFPMPISGRSVFLRYLKIVSVILSRSVFAGFGAGWQPDDIHG